MYAYRGEVQGDFTEGERKMVAQRSIQGARVGELGADVANNVVGAEAHRLGERGEQAGHKDEPLVGRVSLEEQVSSAGENVGKLGGCHHHPLSRRHARDVGDLSGPSQDAPMAPLVIPSTCLCSVTAGECGTLAPPCHVRQGAYTSVRQGAYMTPTAATSLQTLPRPPYGADVPTFGERLAGMREEQGLTLSGAARAAGMTRQTWWQYENGKRANPTIALAAKMAAALGVSLSVLLEGVEVDTDD